MAFLSIKKDTDDNIKSAPFNDGQMAVSYDKLKLYFDFLVNNEEKRISIDGGSSANIILSSIMPVGGNYKENDMWFKTEECGPSIYTITYKANGGSGDDIIATKTEDIDYTVTDNSFIAPSTTIDANYTEDNGYRYKTQHSHSFVKWNTASDGSGTDYNSNSIYTENKNLTLYAIWSDINTNIDEQYYLTIDKDSGVDTCTPSQWVDKGDSVNVTATPKQYYEIVDGLGSSGAMYSAKTVNIITELIALKFSSDEPFTLSVTNPGWLNVSNPGYIEYSIFYGYYWTEWDGSELSGDASQPIYLRGKNNSVITGTPDDATAKWTFTGKYITGNIETLLNYETVANGNHPVMGNACYTYLFKDCSTLITPPDLPAIDLSERCYQNMFADCTSLSETPQLPATTLADYCYNNMFANCDALTTAPELPATTLAEQCYASMFWSCNALTTAPELPATTLAPYCYRRMFEGCPLTRLPSLPAITLWNQCYEYMFRRCSTIKLSTTQDSTYKYAYRIPTIGTGTMATNALNGMFEQTGGTFTGTPTINTTYYTDQEPI